jgi:hypothetical protein
MKREIATFVLLLSGVTFAARPELRQGDWTVGGSETVTGKHIRLDGNLILPEGARLTLEDCTLEIDGDYSREHCVEWKGGTLITRNSVVGGLVNDRGTAIHTVFHLYDGLWEAVDTTVQYSYGVSFHWAEGKGILRGTRLKAGPRPDAIILSGQADVELVDSDFPIGLGLYCNKGGQTSLDLKSNQSVTATFDRDRLLPGVNWRLEMTNTRVGRWFLFLRQIGSYHPPAEITINHSRDLIVSLLGHNLTGEIELSSDLLQPLRVGNVTLKTADKPAGISMYALYFSGDETDVAITGKSHICELMHRGGRLRVFGPPGQPQITIGCTTLELSGDAEMEVRNVHLGRPLTWREETSIGEANVTEGAVLAGRDISVKNVRFRTEGSGKVDLQNVDRHGKLEIKQEGGSIEVEVGG